jgi:hypothetical protein
MLRRLFLVGSAAVARDAVAAEFPTLTLCPVSLVPAGVVLVDGAALFGAHDGDGRDGGDRGAAAWALDRALDDAVEVAIAAGDAADAVALVTRLQRLIDRRTAASATAAFDALLARHRALFDLSKPLVRADYEHARDTWQWLVRLDADASLAAQVAALFHDVERLGSEADARVEQDAADYDAFKTAHAAGGAALVGRVLDGLDGFDPAVVARARELVAGHERPAGGAGELALVADADALSFFSLNSGGYLDYFGPAQAARKIAWTLARLSSRGHARLASIRLRADVRALLPQKEAA